MSVAILDLPHAEARARAAQAPVFLPINPVEYHGPHLSLHNDRLVSHGIIRDLHGRLCPDAPLLIASDLEIGVDPCPGPGTRHTAYPRAARLIREACEALVQIGARQVVLVTFHGSPLHSAAVEVGIRALRRHGVPAAAPFNVILREMLTAVGADYAEAVAHLPEAARAELIARLPRDFHAGFFETSVALHYAPSAVGDHRALPPCPPLTPVGAVRALAAGARRIGAKGLAAELDYAAFGLAWYRLRPFPGYTSRPDLANAESGAFFAKRLIDAMVEPTRAALAGEGSTPPPIMGWLKWATLGGRLPGPSVPVDAVLQLR